VLAVLASTVILAVIGLGFYGLKSRAGRLHIQAGVWRLITFSIEIEPAGGPSSDPVPRAEVRELETGHDKPRELEAGPGDSGPSDQAALRGPRIRVVTFPPGRVHHPRGAQRV
jgi:hypothetical protein